MFVHYTYRSTKSFASIMSLSKNYLNKSWVQLEMLSWPWNALLLTVLKREGMVKQNKLSYYFCLYCNTSILYVLASTVCKATWTHIISFYKFSFILDFLHQCLSGLMYTHVHNLFRSDWWHISICRYGWTRLKFR